MELPKNEKREYDPTVNIQERYAEMGIIWRKRRGETYRGSTLHYSCEMLCNTGDPSARDLLQIAANEGGRKLSNPIGKTQRGHWVIQKYPARVQGTMNPSVDDKTRIDTDRRDFRKEPYNVSCFNTPETENNQCVMGFGWVWPPLAAGKAS